MNKLCFLKEMMKPIVDKCLDKYGGGESYFTEIDSMIKSNPVLMSEYIQYITEKENIYNVILSGEIGLKYFSMYRKHQIPSVINLFLLPGGLRLDASKLYAVDNNILKKGKITSSKYIFLDDSYYSGKTLNAVSDFVKKSGGTIKESYVFYDGSPERTDVKSLYGYYDNLEKKYMNEYLEKHGIEKVEDLIGMTVYHIYPSQGIVQYTIRKISFKTNWIIHDRNGDYDIRELGESIFFNYDEAKNYEYSQLNKINMRQQINKVSREMDKHNEEIDTLYRLLEKYPTEESRKHFYKNCGTCAKVMDECIGGACRDCMENEAINGTFSDWEPDLEKLKELWIPTEN